MTTMHAKFEAAFLPDRNPVELAKVIALPDPYVTSLLAKWGGASFDHSIYRLLRSREVPRWAAIAESAFPEFAGRLIPFGFDWLGRMFALDRQRYVDGALAVSLLEPGTGEALETPCTAESFHEAELIDYREAALAESFYCSWIDAGGAPPTLTQCVGYRKPLFLGGSDTVTNLELIDLDVYWELAVQFLGQTKRLQIGTVIGDVRIE